jgi:hypothetical protein
MLIKNRSISNTLVLAALASVVVLLFMVLAHPFLHDHEIDGRHHEGCPGCVLELFYHSVAVCAVYFIITLCFTSFFFIYPKYSFQKNIIPIPRLRAPPAVL